MCCLKIFLRNSVQSRVLCYVHNTFTFCKFRQQSCNRALRCGLLKTTNTKQKKRVLEGPLDFSSLVFCIVESRTSLKNGLEGFWNDQLLEEICSSSRIWFCSFPPAHLSNYFRLYIYLVHFFVGMYLRKYVHHTSAFYYVDRSRGLINIMLGKTKSIYIVYIINFKTAPINVMLDKAKDSFVYSGHEPLNWPGQLTRSKILKTPFFKRYLKFLP